MEQSQNQNIVNNYAYNIDRKHLLNLLKEKDATIENLKRENERISLKVKEFQKERVNKKVNQSRYWKKDEHERFLEGLERFGKKDVKSIAAFVGTRTPTQVRTHSQKWFLKQKREKSKYDDDDDDYDDRKSSSEESRKSNKLQNFTMDSNSENKDEFPKVHQLNQHNSEYVNYEIQALMTGMKIYEHEKNAVTKAELIRKQFLPHKSVEDIILMMSYTINSFNLDQQRRFIMMSQQVNPNLQQQMNIPQQNFKTPNDSMEHDKYNATQTLQNISQFPPYYDQTNVNMTGRVDPSEISYMSDSLIKKEENLNASEPNQIDQTSFDPNIHDKEEEELVNELQSLYKKNDKNFVSSHPVGFSPIFPGSPFGLGSPFIGSGTPFYFHGLGSPKNATSPEFFIGHDHTAMKRK